MTGVLLAGAATPAGAATSLYLITTGSSNTTVGLGIFANLNLMGPGGTQLPVAPTGDATFRLYGPTDPTCSSPIFTSTVAVASTSVNSSSFVTNQAGTYRWTTSYDGDGNYFGAGPTACASPSADVVVAKARNVLRVTALAPSGDFVSASTTLSGYYPNGTVTFYLTGPNNPYCSGTPLYTGTVAVNGVGTYTSPAYAPAVSGTYIWRASYGGDSDNQGSSVTGCMGSTNSVVFTA